MTPPRALRVRQLMLAERSSLGGSVGRGGPIVTWVISR